MKAWMRRWSWRRERRNLEVYLFNYGPFPRWKSVRDENTRLGVWKGWPL
jgi:hypothetical protein